MRKVFYLACAMWLCGLPACSQQKQTLEERLKSLYQGTVPLVFPQQFTTWYHEDPELVLLDIRSPEEFEVSHITGAQLIDYDRFKPEDVAHLSRNSKVVVYCSVGYRSERIGEKMQELGFQEVYNLYGGIFNWKNQGNAVINSRGQPTDSVHTYNKNWGQWLERGIKVYD